MRSWISVKGRISQGHGVASGKSGDPRFPNGTLAMQKPVFQSLGLNLDEYYMGTVNVSISPKEYDIRKPKHLFKNVKWSLTEPAEDFSFFDCFVLLNNGERTKGLIYYPHPETKPEHFQAPDILEIVMPFIEALKYADELMIEVDDQQLKII